MESQPLQITKDERLTAPIICQKTWELTSNKRRISKELKTKLVLDITGEQITANAAVTLKSYYKYQQGLYTQTKVMY